MAWPELLKAKKNILEISRELDNLLKNHNSLTKKELAKQNDTILSVTDDLLNAIDGQIDEFITHIKNHRKYIESRSRFVRRHYSRKA